MGAAGDIGVNDDRGGARGFLCLDGGCGANGRYPGRSARRQLWSVRICVPTGCTAASGRPAAGILGSGQRPVYTDSAVDHDRRYRPPGKFR